MKKFTVFVKTNLSKKQLKEEINSEVLETEVVNILQG
jgi:hypothetical protein